MHIAAKTTSEAASEAAQMRLVIGGDFPQRSRPRQIGVALGQHSDRRVTALLS